MAANNALHEKETSLRARGALHPHPERVEDEAFLSHEFLDPRDLVQVKYEMLRRHRVDGWTVTRAAATFGSSRQTFYVAQADLESEGVWGLVPQKRGPKGPTKMTEEVLAFVESLRREHPEISPSELVAAMRQAFGTSVHPRTIDRALARREKKRSRRSGGPRQ